MTSVGTPVELLTLTSPQPITKPIFDTRACRWWPVEGSKCGPKWLWTWHGCWHRKSVTQAADALGRSHSTISTVHREWSRKKQMSKERHFTGPKFLAGARDQVELARPTQEERKTRGAPLTTRYDLLISGCLKNIRLCILNKTSLACWLEDWKNVAWHDNSGLQLRQSHGRIRIWCKWHESMKASGWWRWCNGVGDFSWHILGPLVQIKRLNVTAYLSIVVDRVHLFVTTLSSSSDGYFQKHDTPRHKAHIISNRFSRTRPWVHWTPVASTVTKSNRAPLVCGGKGAFFHRCAADELAAPTWCYRVNMDQNLWEIFPTPCWKYATNNYGSFDDKSEVYPTKWPVSVLLWLQGIQMEEIALSVTKYNLARHNAIQQVLSW